MYKSRFVSILIFLAALITFTIYMVRDISSDNKGPVITMTNSVAQVRAEDGQDAILADMAARDNRDGDVSDTLIIESMSNFIEKGRRTATIAAFDSDSNVSKVTRDVVYTDYRSPLFKLKGPLRFPVGTSNILSLLSAEDVIDGSLTDHIRLSSDYMISTGVPGDYQMVYSVTNSAGDTVKLPVTITIYNAAEDAGKPGLNLSAYLVNVKKGETLNLRSYVVNVIANQKTYTWNEGAGKFTTADGTDSLSGEEFRIEDTVDYGTTGVYEAVYHVKARNGQERVLRLIVNVYE